MKAFLKEHASLIILLVLYTILVMLPSCIQS